MATILTTDPDSPYDVEVAGVGVLGGSARGGIPVERAAKVLPEFQDDNNEPLTGNALRVAAEKFAKARGLATRTVKGDVDEEQLRVESGAFPVGPSIEEIATAAAERDGAFLEAHEPPLTTDELPVREVDRFPEPATPVTTASAPTE